MNVATPPRRGSVRILGSGGASVENGGATPSSSSTSLQQQQPSSGGGPRNNVRRMSLTEDARRSRSFSLRDVSPNHNDVPPKSEPNSNSSSHVPISSSNPTTTTTHPKSSSPPSTMNRARASVSGVGGAATPATTAAERFKRATSLIVTSSSSNSASPGGGRPTSGDRQSQSGDAFANTVNRALLHAGGTLAENFFQSQQGESSRILKQFVDECNYRWRIALSTDGNRAVQRFMANEEIQNAQSLTATETRLLLLGQHAADSWPTFAKATRAKAIEIVNRCCVTPFQPNPNAILQQEESQPRPSSSATTTAASPRPPRAPSSFSGALPSSAAAGGGGGSAVFVSMDSYEVPDGDEVPPPLNQDVNLLVAASSSGSPITAAAAAGGGTASPVLLSPRHRVTTPLPNNNNNNSNASAMASSSPSHLQQQQQPQQQQPQELGVVALDDQVFVDLDQMAFVHVWKSRREGRAFQHALLSLTEMRQMALLPPIVAVPYSVALSLQTSLVTVTWMPPLMNRHPLHLDPDTIVSQVEEVWRASVGVNRSDAMLQLYGGGDGRYYAITCDTLANTNATRTAESTLHERFEYNFRDDVVEVIRTGNPATNEAHIKNGIEDRLLPALQRKMKDIKTLMSSSQPFLAPLFHACGVNMQLLHHVRHLFAQLTNERVGQMVSLMNTGDVAKGKEFILVCMDSEIVARTLKSLMIGGVTERTNMFPPRTRQQMGETVLSVCNSVWESFLTSGRFIRTVLLPAIAKKFPMGPDFVLEMDKISMTRITQHLELRLGLQFDLVKRCFTKMSTKPFYLSSTGRKPLPQCPLADAAVVGLEMLTAQKAWKRTQSVSERMIATLMAVSLSATGINLSLDGCFTIFTESLTEALTRQQREKRLSAHSSSSATATPNPPGGLPPDGFVAWGDNALVDTELQVSPTLLLVGILGELVLTESPEVTILELDYLMNIRTIPLSDRMFIAERCMRLLRFFLTEVGTKAIASKKQETTMKALTLWARSITRGIENVPRASSGDATVSPSMALSRRPDHIPQAKGNSAYRYPLPTVVNLEAYVEILSAESIIPWVHTSNESQCLVQAFMASSFIATEKEGAEICASVLLRFADRPYLSGYEDLHPMLQDSLATLRSVLPPLSAFRFGIMLLLAPTLLQLSRSYPLLLAVGSRITALCKRCSIPLPDEDDVYSVLSNGQLLYVLTLLIAEARERKAAKRSTPVEPFSPITLRTRRTSSAERRLGVSMSTRPPSSDDEPSVVPPTEPDRGGDGGGANPPFFSGSTSSLPTTAPVNGGDHPPSDEVPSPLSLRTRSPVIISSSGGGGMARYAPTDGVEAMQAALDEFLLNPTARESLARRYVELEYERETVLVHERVKRIEWMLLEERFQLEMKTFQVKQAAETACFIAQLELGEWYQRHVVIDLFEQRYFVAILEFHRRSMMKLRRVAEFQQLVLFMLHLICRQKIAERVAEQEEIARDRRETKFLVAQVELIEEGYRQMLEAEEDRARQSRLLPVHLEALMITDHLVRHQRQSVWTQTTLAMKEFQLRQQLAHRAHTQQVVLWEGWKRYRAEIMAQQLLHAVWERAGRDSLLAAERTAYVQLDEAVGRLTIQWQAAYHFEHTLVNVENKQLQSLRIQHELKHLSVEAPQALHALFVEYVREQFELRWLQSRFLFVLYPERHVRSQLLNPLAKELLQQCMASQRQGFINHELTARYAFLRTWQTSLLPFEETRQRLAYVYYVEEEQRRMRLSAQHQLIRAYRQREHRGRLDGEEAASRQRLIAQHALAPHVLRQYELLALHCLDDIRREERQEYAAILTALAIEEVVAVRQYSDAHRFTTQARWRMVPIEREVRRVFVQEEEQQRLRLMELACRMHLVSREIWVRCQCETLIDRLIRSFFQAEEEEARLPQWYSPHPPLTAAMMMGGDDGATGGLVFSSPPVRLVRPSGGGSSAAVGGGGGLGRAMHFPPPLPQQQPSPRVLPHTASPEVWYRGGSSSTPQNNRRALGPPHHSEAAGPHTLPRVGNPSALWTASSSSSPFVAWGTAQRGGGGPPSSAGSYPQYSHSPATTGRTNYHHGYELPSSSSAQYPQLQQHRASVPQVHSSPPYRNNGAMLQQRWDGYLAAAAAQGIPVSTTTAAASSTVGGVNLQLPQISTATGATTGRYTTTSAHAAGALPPYTSR